MEEEFNEFCYITENELKDNITQEEAKKGGRNHRGCNRKKIKENVRGKEAKENLKKEEFKINVMEEEFNEFCYIAKK